MTPESLQECARPVTTISLARAWDLEGEIAALKHGVENVQAKYRQMADAETLEDDAMIRALQEERDRIVAACIDAGIYQDGEVYLQNTARTVRTVDPHRFESAWPEVFATVAEIRIPIQKATSALEKALGVTKSKAARLLDEVCDEIQGSPVWKLRKDLPKGGLRE